MLFNSISVIVCCYNSQYKIGSTLEYLSKQKLSSFQCQWEIILIDNGSTDKTLKVAQNAYSKFAGKVPVKLLTEFKAGKANALITGFDAAKYELMLVCDDDNWLHEDYLANVFELYNKYPEIGMLGGYGSEAWFGNELKPTWFDLNSKRYVVGNHIGSSGFLQAFQSNIWGAGSVLRKKMWNFLRAQGFEFNNSIRAGKAMGEDAELSHAIACTGHKLYFDERLTFIHDLSGNRVNEIMFRKMIELSGKTSGCFFLKRIVAKQFKYDKSHYFLFFYTYEIMKLFNSLRKSFKWKYLRSDFFQEENYANYLYEKYLLAEVVFNYRKYFKKRNNEMRFFKNIYSSYPLSSEKC